MVFGLKIICKAVSSKLLTKKENKNESRKIFLVLLAATFIFVSDAFANMDSIVKIENATAQHFEKNIVIEIEFNSPDYDMAKLKLSGESFANEFDVLSLFGVNIAPGCRR